MVDNDTRLKRKRNRKKKGKGVDKKVEDALATNTMKFPQQETNADFRMNTHAILRNELISHGFSGDEVDRAKEEMWDKGLKYDEFESVLKYLKSRGKGEEGKEDIIKKENRSLDSEGSSTVEVEKEKKCKAVEKEKPKPAPPMTMAAKLDMVASHGNLTDGIFALTEWVTKAAKPYELEEICAAQITNALPLILQRSILESEDQSRFDTAILPAMLRFMSGLLSRCSIPPNSARETMDSFETILKQARRLIQTKQPFTDGLAERVSEFIVARFSLVVDESIIATSDVANKVEDEMDSWTSSLASNVDQGIAELLAKREMHKTAARRSNLNLRSVCAPLITQSGSVPMSIGSTRETDRVKSDIFLAILGPDAKNAFDEQKAKVHELESQTEEGEGDGVHGLRRQLEELNSEREIIARRIADLKRSVDELEVYHSELCAKVADLNVDLKVECETQSESTIRMDEQVGEASAVKYGDLVRSLVDTLKAYDDSLDRVVNEPVQSIVENSEVGEAASKTMDIFLFRCRNYFASESQCVDFLLARIHASQREAAELKIEIAECEGLGMVTTIAQMEETRRSKEELVVKDTNLVERLMEEASLMFDILIARLEQYNAARDCGNHTLTPIYSNTLHDIPSLISNLGLKNGGRLDPFLATNGIDQSDPRATGAFKVPNTIETTFVSQPTTVPKLTWANGSKSAGLVRKVSLLDIQKEELESKADT